MPVTIKGKIVPDFGDYVLIEMKRHGCENEHYQHKVVGPLKSNGWVDVPVQSPATETFHNRSHDVVRVVRCICDGIDETTILKYRVCDVKLMEVK